MKHKLPILLITLLAVWASPVQHLRAGEIYLRFSVLSFPGASATNCGQWRLSASSYMAITGEIFEITLTDGNGVTVYHATFASPEPSLGYWSYPNDFQLQPTKNPIHAVVTLAGDSMGDLYADNPCLPPVLPPLPPLFFNPEDGRVDGRPGDRIAVWCNPASKPPNVDVFGVDTQGGGFHLATFVIADLIAAGPKGMTVNLGETGTVSAMIDDQNNLYIAHNGGSQNATGQGDFAKSIHCNFIR